MSYIFSPLKSSQIVACGAPMADIILLPACVAHLNERGHCTLSSCVKKIRTKSHTWDPYGSLIDLGSKISALLPLILHRPLGYCQERKKNKNRSFIRCQIAGTRVVSPTIPQSGITSFGSRNETGWHRSWRPLLCIRQWYLVADMYYGPAASLR